MYHRSNETKSVSTFILLLSCNGEAWGIGPTVLFALAAATGLWHELDTATPQRRRRAPAEPNYTIERAEATLMYSIIAGLLVLLIHIWVCTTTFLQHYLETIVEDYPLLLIEIFSMCVLGVPAAPHWAQPLVRLLRAQTMHVHAVACWLLALACADYVRRYHMQYYDLPFLDQIINYFEFLRHRDPVNTASNTEDGQNGVVIHFQDNFNCAKQYVSEGTAATKLQPNTDRLPNLEIDTK